MAKLGLTPTSGEGSAATGTPSPYAPDREQAAADSIYESAAPLRAQNRIDESTFAQWKKLGIEPARLCSDAVFLRRACIDVIGTLPTAAEAEAFLADPNPGKRAVLIDALLERDEFADYWAMRWSDVLRIKAEFPINLWPEAAQAYHHWVRDALRDDMPYDAFVRALLTASGSNFLVAPANFYRAVQAKDPKTLAQTVALTWMGTRADNWPPEKLAAMSVFFSHVGYKATQEWKEEIVFFDRTGASGGVKRTTQQLAAVSLPRAAVLPDGTRVQLSGDKDPREVFAAWLTTARNPWFSRAIVNRVWFWLLGRGLFADPNEAGLDAQPENPALLRALEDELLRSQFHLKPLYRLILNSQTYQLSSIPRSDRTRSLQHFAAYPIQRLDAEVLIDALCQLTASSEEYSSQVPEPYTYMPAGQRAVGLPDGSISSAFLDQFGKPARDTGQLTERVNTPTAGQRLHMLNSTHVQKKLQQARPLLDLLIRIRDNGELANQLYLMILSRFPTAAERNLAAKRLGTGSRREAETDVAWALINSTEFLYRH